MNGRSHDASVIGPARLAGWRRVWRGTDLRGPAYLSVEPCAGVGIDGMLASVPADGQAALDAREAAYTRQDASAQITPRLSGPVALYVVPPAHWDHSADPHPILLSYLDVVVSGFLDAFGPEGVARFFTTTAGWRAVQDDRAAPIYPRAEAASMAGRRAVDAALPRLC